MTGEARIDRLRHLARMRLDRDLMDLSGLARQRDALQDRLEGLNPAPAPDLDPLTAARIAAQHQIWADGKRAEINLALARSRAEWLAARDLAARSFGRWQVLCKLSSDDRDQLS